MSEELEDLREQIDSLDEELLKVLAKRTDVVRAVGRYKKANDMALRDDKRLKSLLTSRIQLAESLDLPKELINELYELIHKYALETEKEA